MEAATQMVQETVGRMLLDDEIHPHVVVLAVAQVAGELMGALAAADPGTRRRDLLHPRKRPRAVSLGARDDRVLPGRRGEHPARSSRCLGGERLQLVDVGLGTLGKQLDHTALRRHAEIHILLGNRHRVLDRSLDLGQHSRGLALLVAAQG